MSMKYAHSLILILVLAAAANAEEAPPSMAAGSITLAGAHQLLDTAQSYAKAHAAPGAAIAIVDSAGNLVVLERLDGTFPAAPAVSTGKARTAVLFAKPTHALEDAVNTGRFTMVTLPEVTSFTPLKGGVPIVAGGRIVGAIGVSGAASADQDDEIAQAAVDAFTKTLAQADSVTHLDHTAVSAAFKSGAHLVRGPGYKVDASRRDGSGEAEVHTQDTDVFYVVSGHATFVTGGEMVDPHTTAPNEIRGTSIRNGTTQKLSAGDVVVVPSGVPHWFQTVAEPFDYFVVKSQS
jgi:glc operon protein GlcG